MKKRDLFDMQVLLDSSYALSPRPMVVVNPYDGATLESVFSAMSGAVVDPILVGKKALIRKGAETVNIPLEGMCILPADEDSTAVAASLICEGKAHFIMKGMVGTGAFFHVLFEPRFKIRTQRVLSHVGMFEIPSTKRIFLMSDAAINILPNFSRKIHIISNAVDAAHKLGFPQIRVALLAAVEKLNLPAMPATLDAFLMKRFAKTGYFGRCEVDGPFAFDNAIDPRSAGTKGIGGNVAGNANILIAPNIETGNVIWKSITCIHGGDAAGVVLGGTCPIVVPSRADNAKTKLNSILFSRLLLE
jgi:phosphotransacetylase